MRRQRVISDAAIRKRLRRIQRKVQRNAKKQVRKGYLTGVSLELYLGSIDETYEHLKAELATGHGAALVRLQQLRAELVGQAQNALNTLGNDSHRLQQAYETAQRKAKEAEYAESDIAEKNKITIEPLHERLTKIKGSPATSEES